MPKRNRISIELSRDWVKILDKLRSDTRATSNNELTRKAMDLYRVLHDQTTNGWELVLKKNGTEKPILIP